MGYSRNCVANSEKSPGRILFETKDVTQVKSYLQDQWMSILSGRVSEQDFVLAQEVRLGEYKYVLRSVLDQR
jgi:hypothetical protein